MNFSMGGLSEKGYGLVAGPAKGIMKEYFVRATMSGCGVYSKRMQVSHFGTILSLADSEKNEIP